MRSIRRETKFFFRRLAEKVKRFSMKVAACVSDLVYSPRLFFLAPLPKRNECALNGATIPTGEAYGFQQEDN